MHMTYTCICACIMHNVTPTCLRKTPGHPTRKAYCGEGEGEGEGGGESEAEAGVKLKVKVEVKLKVKLKLNVKVKAKVVELLDGQDEAGVRPFMTAASSSFDAAIPTLSSQLCAASDAVPLQQGTLEGVSMISLPFSSTCVPIGSGRIQ